MRVKNEVFFLLQSLTLGRHLHFQKMTIDTLGNAWLVMSWRCSVRGRDFHSDTLGQVCWNWHSCSLREDFWKSIMYLHYVSTIYSLKMHTSSFEQIWIIFTQEYFVSSSVKTVRAVSEKKISKYCQYIFT